MQCPNSKCDGVVNAIGIGPQPATMDYLSIHNCYVCPWCGGEWWEGDSKGGKVTTEEAQEVYQDELRRQNAIRKKGSSRKAGRKRKDKVIKAVSWWVRE